MSDGETIGWGEKFPHEQAGADREELEALRQKVAVLEKSNSMLLAACVEFVRKVDCGEARSVRSYRQMKEAIAFSKGERK